MAKTPQNEWLAKRDSKIFGLKTRGGIYRFDGIVAGEDTCKTGKKRTKGERE
jgi:hypothetical protein